MNVRSTIYHAIHQLTSCHLNCDMKAILKTPSEHTEMIYKLFWRHGYMKLDNYEIQDKYNIITKYHMYRKESFLFEIFLY